MKKQTFFISSGLQTDLGLYIPSEHVERTPKNITKEDDGFGGEVFRGIIKVQGVDLVVESEIETGAFDICNILTRRLFKKNKAKA